MANDKDFNAKTARAKADLFNDMARNLMETQVQKALEIIAKQVETVTLVGRYNVLVSDRFDEKPVFDFCFQDKSKNITPHAELLLKRLREKHFEAQIDGSIIKISW